MSAVETATERLYASIDQRTAEACPLRDVLDRVGDKWSVLVVLCLSESTHRFSALRRRIEGVSQRMLTETLRQLERDGIVRRTVYPDVPVRVEYALTELGQTLIGPLATLAAWAEEHRAAIVSARAAYDERLEA
ncbi:MAG: helix-turn-helix domain-containing protein [Roseiflexaceae bacterium]